MEEIKIESVEVEVKKPYTLKKLNASNIFTFSTILNKIGFKELKSCFQSEDIQSLISNTSKDGGKANVEKIGLTIMIDVATVVISNLEACKDSIFQLLSDLSGMSKKEITELDMNVFVEMIFDVFKKEEFKDFFKVVSKLFK